MTKNYYNEKTTDQMKIKFMRSRENNDIILIEQPDNW